jgi:hypothetical protein
MLKRVLIVLAATCLVAAGGVLTLQYRLPVGPLVLALSAVPLLALRFSGRRLSAALPDLVFGGIDTGLLAVPAVAGGLAFGVAGAIAGGVIGDSLTDAVAGFFEGGVAEWLRDHGFVESREAVTTSLGKMAGCLIGSGSVLTIAMLFGVNVQAA